MQGPFKIAMIDKKIETSDDLLEAYMRKKNMHVGIKLANQHIDKQVIEDLNKTIVSLNNFCVNVNKTSKLIDKEKDDKDKRDMDMFNEKTRLKRKSMGT